MLFFVCERVLLCAQEPPGSVSSAALDHRQHGSIIIDPHIGRVAQLAEHSTLNRLVEGSIPSASTI